ncbi:beta-ketoacyl-[acyl-carrier-protein] synthase family protein [Natrinema sp. SYSU A 869]|uniref:beta-ketoacyl-[acyl-carrier-protein] synthase family protein n=1 Tax=Natrinema sp. SYSU A 869 TaxID=2871694 RepID=UPI002102B694|nr:beta-ketoacyl-[acyl-carrier-protein] synthase family protein [Natrinema sp. SYSU A 869]
MNRAVAITGLGAVTPLGTTATETWDALCAGERSGDRIQRFEPDEAGLRTTVACEVDEVPPVPWEVNEQTASRAARYGLAAAREALVDAGYDPEDPAWEPDRAGTSIACALGGVPELEEVIQDSSRPSPWFLLTYLPNLVGGHLSMAVNARGPSRTQSTACAAGTHSLADAAEDVRRGRADIVLAGGAESAISPVGVGSFESMRALSKRNDDPAAACRPFDADRDGFVLGEGSAVLVLESVSHAQERDAPIYAILSGSGITADAHHPTRPAENGTGLARSVERALADAGLPSGAIDHVNAHGTGTPAGDSAEAAALSEIFETVPPTTSVKGALGHALGAAGAIEAVVAARTIESGTLPRRRTTRHLTRIAISRS